MNFDTVIIGGGLSGLACGISLQQQGQKCAIVSIGQSALHFSSGSFDLCSFPNGNSTTNLKEKVSDMLSQKVDHPYQKIGEENLESLMIRSKKLLSDAGIETYGNEKHNHYRVTPMGKLTPTWLIQKGCAMLDNSVFPWKKVQIFDIDGYLDFFADYIENESVKKRIEVIKSSINLPVLDILRSNPTGLIATSIARELDKKENKQQLIDLLKSKQVNSDIVLLPACMGSDCDTISTQLSKELGVEVMLIPTLPPSVAGATMQNKLVSYFKHTGGVYMLGDTVNKADIENDTVKRIYTTNHTDIPLSASNFVLSSGGLFSKGLIASNRDVQEPLFNLDVIYERDRNQWYNKNIFQPQAYQSFGINVDNHFRGTKDNKAFKNLYAIGAILGNCNPLSEGSGGGIALLSALFVSDLITKGGIK